MSIKSIFFIFIFLSQATFSGELYETYSSVRGLGMGDAFSAIVDDKDAVFYNPAGLDKIRGIHLTLLDLLVGTDAYNSYSNLKDLNDSTKYASALSGLFGKQIWFGLADTAAVSFRGFTAAAYNNLNASLMLRNPAFPNLNLSLTNDVGMVIGLGFSLLPQDILRLGFTAKRITRLGARVPFGVSTIGTLSNSAIADIKNNYGSGYGADGGILLEIPYGAHPTFSLAWMDIGETRFINTGGTTTLPVIKNNIIVGMALDLDLKILNIRPAFEIRHFTDYTEALGKKLHAGIEFDFPILSIRGGTNQGYYTAGAGINLHFLKIEAATYGVEIGEYTGQKEDRRYILQVLLDLNFDPSFNFSKSGAARKAYQRR